MPTILTYNFMIHAFLAGLLIAVLAPVIGNFLLMKRLAMAADTLSHLSLVGIALGILTGYSPLWLTLGVTVLAAWLIEWLQQQHKLEADAVLAMFLPGGLAIALVLISLAAGFNSNLFAYLFGSITTVSATELWPILVLGSGVLLTIWCFYHPLLFTVFDPEGARVRGVRVRWFNWLLMTLTAITVALSVKVVGTLLVSALMVIPSMTGARLGRSFRHSLYYSVAAAILAVIGGLWAAFYLNLPAGAAIVLVALGLFGMTLLTSRA